MQLKSNQEHMKKYSNLVLIIYIWLPDITCATKTVVTSFHPCRGAPETSNKYFIFRAVISSKYKTYQKRYKCEKSFEFSDIVYLIA